jgi:hypothetical protein
VVVEGSMNAAQYQEIIQDFIISETEVIREQFGVEMVFMQDNAPCHKAKAVMSLFAKKRVQLLDWSPQSPSTQLKTYGQL